MNRVLVASTTAVVLIVASFATSASAATVVPARSYYYAPFFVGSGQVSQRHVQKHPFYRSYGNHYGFGPGHHQY